MGSTSSKFRKALQRGEEIEAMQLYLKYPEIKRNLDPHLSYGENLKHNTIFHYACFYGMKPFIRDFLSEGANPNKRNSLSQTGGHLLCMVARGEDPAVDKHRKECMALLLCSGDCSASLDVHIKDQRGNTVLHYAAASGLLQCIQDSITCSELDNDLAHIPLEELQPHSGLCAQDLQEAKDQLLVETADMLMVPLFTAEALLRDHEWSREHLVEAWMTDAKAACEKAGVRLPEGYSETERNKQKTRKLEEPCMICSDDLTGADVLPVALPCGHEACCLCWERYLNVKIRDGEAHNILCPAYNCNTLVPLETIEKLVSKEMATRYLQFDIKAFVESNPNLKWCPASQCGRAVRLPSEAQRNLTPPPRGRGKTETPCVVVDCGGGHRFCWECLQEAHEPCSCELWTCWLKRIAEMLAKIPTSESENLEECPETNQVANTLWLVTNSKPCPNCKSPIQKTEGCNHMKCTKCKHEFCWVCLELWKKHSSATGGYFRCNRYEVVRKLDIEAVSAIKEANAENLRIQELNYFLHYYSRFKNHENSYKIEEPLLGAAKEKMKALAESAVETGAFEPVTSLEEVDTKFVEDAVRELLKSRLVLKASYAYGHFLTGNREKKTIFELIQTEVEEAIESLSQMVARPYLRTPRSHIIQATSLLANKRRTFLLALTRGLIPEEEPPAMERLVSRLTFLPMPSGSGDEESDEEESNYNEVRKAIETSIRQQLGYSAESSSDSTPPGAGIDSQCARAGCSNRRASSRYTGQMSNYCCYDCLRVDMRNRRRRKKNKVKQSKKVERAFSEDAYMDVDMLRAIQLSLDQQSESTRCDNRPTDRPHSASSSSSSSASDGDNTQNTSLQRALELSYGDLIQETPDEDLKRAIALSLQDSGLPSDSLAKTSTLARTDESAASHKGDWDSTS
ncbi:ankyrin repeat and IBR domain-containing protein 1 isoform X2 [Nematostella vectensis]|uniref:ankyrin repeat and IBR domain-containing protein 1 isoform X2 n=1 Tax=Nematostella vectensis TaxID=45351 RepID=UPI0020773E7F|nr:ankyrin repeat and IBR domain-containing protein 1 isoform X2 [Nematostella vectensis]